jgi:hypothetical protein
MSEQATPRTYTAAQIAGILQIPLDEVYRMGNGIPGRFKIGGRTRWRADVVDGWLDEGCPGQAA